MMKNLVLSVLFCLAFAGQMPTKYLVVTGIRPERGHIVEPEGFPEIGKWMFNEHFKPADWLNHKYFGKILFEPINIVIIDSVSKSEDEAVKRLVESCRKAGYHERAGHSAEYMGFIGGNFYKQIPSGIGRAFSDAPFDTDNNHGRIFGPYIDSNRLYFIGSFSREDFFKGSHKFDSFLKARDDFSGKMNDNTIYRVAGKINLFNMIMYDPILTSGDHDGIAVVIHTGDPSF
jgi:hypothetical protein